MTEFLLESGADPNLEGVPMKAAVHSSWPELVKLLEKLVFTVVFVHIIPR